MCPLQLRLPSPNQTGCMDSSVNQVSVGMAILWFWQGC